MPLAIADSNRGAFILRATVGGLGMTAVLAGVYVTLGAPRDALVLLATHLWLWVLLAVWLLRGDERLTNLLSAAGLMLTMSAGVFLTRSSVYLAWLGVLAESVFFVGGTAAARRLALPLLVAAGLGLWWLASNPPLSLGGNQVVLAVRAGGLVLTLFLLGYAYEQARAQSLAAANRAATEALSASQTQARFLAQVSHELRTPLNGIVGMAQALGSEPLTGQGRRDLDTLTRSGMMMLALVNDLIDTARGGSGDFTISKAPLDFSALVRDVVALNHPAAAHKHLGLEAPAGLPLWVEGDEARLRQVLGTLVSNAVKYTEQGRVSVRTRTVPVGEAVALTVEVTDSGPGIPPEEAQLLFTPFTQLSTAKGKGGTGLGLAIAREVTRRMGGSVDLVETGPGGTTFQVKLQLPRVAPPQGAAAPTPAPAPGVRAPRVLVVDDNAVNLTVARRLLMGLGATVVTAPGGEEALEAVRGQAFDLVLMDLQMPGLDGFQTTRRLREQGWHGPVVAVTASALPETTDACLQAGMLDCLVKPVRSPQFRELLRALVLDAGPAPRPAAVGA